jgi:hypothetical protein
LTINQAKRHNGQGNPERIIHSVGFNERAGLGAERMFSLLKALKNGSEAIFFIY